MYRKKTHIIKLTSLALLLTSAAFSYAQTTNSEVDDAILEKIITPDLERRTITEDQLDSEDWEIGLYTGIFSIEDFGSNSVNGIRLAYHMTEDFVIELNYGLTEAKESSIEVLGGGIQLLTSDQREYSYYNIAIVYNIFQGEVFFGENTAYNSTFYILLGGGNTTFNENDYFTYSIGGGLRFYLTDYLALHATVKDHIFNNDIIEDKSTNNLEATLGLSFYF
ncbi:MAG: outer membrane beta-barrel protein [Cellvibrionaceae bacterium]|jgi:outer membrane beta-barrel protein